MASTRRSAPVREWLTEQMAEILAERASTSVRPTNRAQRMGHSDPTLTLRVYGHLFDGAQEKLTAELDQLRRDLEAKLGDRMSMPLASPPVPAG